MGNPKRGGANTGRTPAVPPAPPPTGFGVQTGDGRSLMCDREPFSYGSEGRLFFTADKQHVVKMYNRPEDWRRQSLDAIIRKRAVVLGDNAEYWARYFCWPEALVMKPGLGVYMPRARTGLRPLSHFLSPRFRKRIAAEDGPPALGTWIGHVGILMKLARTVNRLHANGLCHSDLSTNNLLVNPVTGDATLIDCDGLVESGSSVLLPTVLGTPDFMAPELVAGMTPRPGERPPQPSVETDRHSLAVLIYYGLLFRHPLRGNKFHSPDPDLDDRLMLGRGALFIEHPSDLSNRPKGNFLKSSILGKTMQDLFARAFVDGLHHPRKRPLAAEWEGALVRLYDQTVPCSNPRCEAKSFVFVDGGVARCPWCSTDLKGPRQIPILAFCKPDGKRALNFPVDFRLVGWPRRTLHTWHVELNRLPGPGVEATPAGRVPVAARPKATRGLDAAQPRHYTDGRCHQWHRPSHSPRSRSGAT